MSDYNRAEFERIFGGTLLMIIGKDGEYDSSLTYWAYKGWVARQSDIDTLRGERTNKTKPKFTLKLSQSQKEEFHRDCISALEFYEPTITPESSTKKLLKYWDGLISYLGQELLSDASIQIIEEYREYKKTKSNKRKSKC